MQPPEMRRNWRTKRCAGNLLGKGGKISSKFAGPGKKLGLDFWTDPISRIQTRNRFAKNYLTTFWFRGYNLYIKIAFSNLSFSPKRNCTTNFWKSDVFDSTSRHSPCVRVSLLTPVGVKWRPLRIRRKAGAFVQMFFRQMLAEAKML